MWPVALGTWLLAVCLLGTQWLGLTHAIEHRALAAASAQSDNGADFQARAAMPGAQAKAVSPGSHAEHNCTLFDALALASCAGTPVALVFALPVPQPAKSQGRALSWVSAPFASYESRAPPAFLS